MSLPLPPALLPAAPSAMGPVRTAVSSPRRAYAAPSKQPAPTQLAAGGELFLTRYAPDPLDNQPQPILKRGSFIGSRSLFKSFSQDDLSYQDRPLTAPHIPAHVAFTRDQAMKEAARARQLAAEAERQKDKEKLAQQEQRVRDLEAKLKEMKELEDRLKEYELAQAQRTRSPMLAVARSSQQGSSGSLFSRLRDWMSPPAQVVEQEAVPAADQPQPEAKAEEVPVVSQAAPEPEVEASVAAEPKPVEPVASGPTPEELAEQKAADRELRRAQREAERRLESLRRVIKTEHEASFRMFNERQRMRLSESRPNLNSVHVRAVLTQLKELLDQCDASPPEAPAEPIKFHPGFLSISSPADERVIALSALPQARDPAAKLLGSRRKLRREKAAGTPPAEEPVAIVPPAKRPFSLETPAPSEDPSAAVPEAPVGAFPRDLRMPSSLKALRIQAANNNMFRASITPAAEPASAPAPTPAPAPAPATATAAEPKAKKAKAKRRGSARGAKPDEPVAAQTDVAADVGEFASLLRERHDLKRSYVLNAETPAVPAAPSAAEAPANPAPRRKSSLSSSQLPSLLPSASSSTSTSTSTSAKDSRSFHSFGASLRRAFSSAAAPPTHTPAPDADGDIPVPPVHKPATHRSSQFRHGDRPRPSHHQRASGLRLNPAVAEQIGDSSAPPPELTFVPLSPDSFRLQTVHSPPADRPVPELAKELRAVLQNQGTHATMPLLLSQQRLPFSPYFAQIRQPDEIDFKSIPPFVSCSRDALQARLARKSGCTLMASTSSSTSLLSHIFFVFSNFSSLDLRSFSHSFHHRPSAVPFAFSTRMPVSVVLRNRKDGLWGMDSHPKYDTISNKILVELGKTMERMATMEPEEFERMMLKTPMLKNESSEGPKSPPASLKPVREPAVFLKAKHTLFRSQLDAIMNVNGIPFDLKTRATSPIRVDPRNYEHLTDYRIVSAKGKWFSFEREHYDMARTAFLKYIFQCRLGRMGGVMVTYHNTRDVFGYEFIALEQMEKVVFGSSALGERVFRSAVSLLEAVLTTITAKHVDAPAIKLTFHSHPDRQCLRLFAEVIPPKQAQWTPIKSRVSTDAGEPTEALLPFPLKTESALRNLLQIDQLSDQELNNLLRALKLADAGERHVRLQRLEAHTGRYMRHAQILPTIEDISPLIGQSVFSYELRIRHKLDGTPVLGQLVDGQNPMTPDDIRKLETEYSFEDVTGRRDPLVLAEEYAKLLHDTVLKSHSLPDMAEMRAEANDRFDSLERQYRRLLNSSADIPRNDPSDVLNLDEELEEARNLSVAVKVALGEDPTTAVPMAAKALTEAVQPAEGDLLRPGPVLAKMVPRG